MDLRDRIYLNREIKGSSCTSSTFWTERVYNRLLGVGGIFEGLGERILCGSLRTLSSDVGIVGFDGPGILGVYRNDVASPMRSRITDGGIGAGSNGFIYKR